jgi:hypothetical protein
VELVVVGVDACCFAHAFMFGKHDARDNEERPEWADET